MKQRVGGFFLGIGCALAVSCGDAGTGSTDNPGASASAGMSSPAAPMGGTPASSGAKAGTTGNATSGAAGTGTSTSPVSGSAGATATAAAGGGSAGMAASAAAAGMSAAGSSASAAGSSAAGGCGAESFAAIYDSIFKNTKYNCTGALCHGREAAMAMTVGGLSMSSASVAYMQLVKAASTGTACMGKTRVVPGDPMNSLLVQKLRGANVSCGGAMPPNGEEINDADLKRITDWISGGACNN